MQSLPSDIGDMVFAKTPKGWAEVAQRRAGLNGRQRNILILLDGQRRLGALGGFLPEQELAAIVATLLELQLIASQAALPVSAPRSGSAGDNPIAPPAVAAPADAAKLAHIKSMMTSSAESYLGLMAADVVRRVEQASDETQLLSVLGHWHMAMRDSKYGKAVAGTHLAQIKAAFAGSLMLS